jgi:hypothetical protein
MANTIKLVSYPLNIFEVSAILLRAGVILPLCEHSEFSYVCYRRCDETLHGQRIFMFGCRRIKRCTKACTGMEVARQLFAIHARVIKPHVISTAFLPELASGDGVTGTRDNHPDMAQCSGHCPNIGDANIDARATDCVKFFRLNYFQPDTPFPDVPNEIPQTEEGASKGTNIPYGVGETGCKKCRHGKMITQREGFDNELDNAQMLQTFLGGGQLPLEGMQRAPEW